MVNMLTIGPQDKGDIMLPVTISFNSCFDHGWSGKRLEKIEVKGELVWSGSTKSDCRLKEFSGIKLDETNDYMKKFDREDVSKKLTILDAELLPVTLIWCDHKPYDGGTYKTVIAEKGEKMVHETEYVPVKW